MAHYNVQSESLNKASVSLIMPWMVWGLGCLFYFYECLLQVSPSVMSNELMRDFSVTSHTLGILSGIYFYSYAAMQLPGGVLMDYFTTTFINSCHSGLCREHYSLWHDR